MVVCIMDDLQSQIVQFEAGSNPIETGLVPVTSAVTPPQLPEGWSVPKVLELIDALARDLYDQAHILKQFTLTPAEFKLLQENEWFQKAVDAARAQWSKADNVHQRLAIEAALVLEKNLPALSSRMGKATEPLAAVATLAKLFAEIAGQVGGANKTEPPKEHFKIIFNLGADVQQFNKTLPTPTLVRINTEGESDGTSLQALLEAPGEPAPVQGDGQGSRN